MKRKLSTIVLLVFILGLYGCPVKPTPTPTTPVIAAVDKAGMITEQLNTRYLSLYGTARDLSLGGTDQQKTLIKKVINPKLNEAKKYLIMINDGMVVWKETGFDSANVNQCQADLIKLLEDITKLIFTTT